MPKLRVLACAYTCCPPGVEGFSGGEDLLGWNLVNQIARHHEIWALTRELDWVSEAKGEKQEVPSSVHFVYVGLPSFLRPLLRFQGSHQLYYYLWQVKAYLVARSLHKRFDFQLFHHITYANDWMASYIGALLPIPYVRGPGGGAHRTPKGLEREYSFGGRVWEQIRVLGQWVCRLDPYFMKGQSRAQTILVCNQDSLSKVALRWKDKTYLFPVSGICATRLTPLSLTKQDDGKFRVLSAGSLIRVKGFHLALRAFQEFAANRPQAVFNIIGSGPEESRLRATIQEHHLEGQVKLIPWMSQEELLRRMESCDVFLFPSLRDGGGTVVVEAMSVGKPVVCLDTGGPGTHISDECGIKVIPKSPEQSAKELAAALEKLYLDEQLRSRLGNAGWERAKKIYLWDKLGERLMEVYNTALEKRC